MVIANIIGVIIIIVLVCIAFYAFINIIKFFLLFYARHCKYCDHTMDFKGYHTDKGEHYYTFHCPHCGAWDKVKRDELL